MSPELADLIVRWLARLVVACYAMRCWVDFRISRKRSWFASRALARWIWTIGCILFVFHVGTALAWVHHYDHAAAYEHTAERTFDVIGVRWGGGIYVNHLFLLFWVFDSLLWWRAGVDGPYRLNIYYWFVQAVFAFMFLNATVVFGPSHWIVILPVVVTCFVLSHLFVELQGKFSSAHRKRS